MWQMALPIAMKVGSAILNARNEGKNRKRAEKASNMDSLVGLLSKGNVQSHSTPKQRGSMWGDLLGMGGDAAMIYQAMGGGSNTPKTQSNWTPLNDYGPAAPITDPGYDTYQDPKMKRKLLLEAMGVYS